jgi:RHS repeat-associated protein
MEGASTINPPNKYTYNGKELNGEFGLEWLDYGARWYDASVGRWWSVDPLAEEFAFTTPYNSFLSNPINIIDMNGDSSWPVTRQWEGRDADAFSSFADSEIDRMQTNSEEFDCADLATTILIRYASQNGLEVSFTSVEGEEINSSADLANNPEEFERVVKASTNAKSIANDMNRLLGVPAPGDMTNDGFHVNIVTNPEPNTVYDSNGVIPTASGTLPQRVPKDSSVPLGSKFVRWNVIGEAKRAEYEDKK